eukprot:s137_g24.t1
MLFELSTLGFPRTFPPLGVVSWPASPEDAWMPGVMGLRFRRIALPAAACCQMAVAMHREHPVDQSGSSAVFQILQIFQSIGSSGVYLIHESLAVAEAERC